MRDTSALTLVEILVALAVFAIGAAALVGMQLSALRLTLNTTMQSRLLYIAETELNYRLHRSEAASDCQAPAAVDLDGLSCSASEERCVAHLAGFECGSGPARRITVTVRPQAAEQPLVLSTVTRAGIQP